MAGSLATRENAMNVNWAYNWSNNLPETLPDAHFEFVPMIWSANVGGVQNQINNILSYKDELNIDTVLGFNEPERSSQANMSVTQAIDVWDIMTDEFAGTGIDLISPAVSGGSGLTWLSDFMTEVDLRNGDADTENDLQVDGIAFHWYGPINSPQGAANDLFSKLQTLWTDYGRPIWLTEFAGLDFGNAKTTQEMVDFNAEFLEIVIPQLEALPYVEKYSWWQFNSDSSLSSVSNSVYTPSAIGDVYVGTLQSGDSLDFSSSDSQPTDVQYLRGGSITNTGGALTTALRAIDSIEGIGTISGTSDWGVSGGEDSFVRVRAGSTLQKLENNTIAFRGNPIYNDGDLHVLDGTLSLENGAEISGIGTTRVESGSILSLGSAADTAGSSIRQGLELDNGRIRVIETAGGSHTISGNTALESTSTFSLAGDLTMTGQASGAGGITKSGVGTLYVNGNNTYSGITTIQEGKLNVASLVGSATGTGAVEVGSSAKLAGFGLISGPVTAQANSTVAPGISESNLGISSVPPINSGVVVNAIDFDFAGVQDDAPLTQTTTLNPAIELVSGFDFGAGLFPRNAVNDGNEFNVAGFSTDSNYNGAFNNEDYMTFTVAPVDGLAMILEDVTYELRRNGSGAAKSYRVQTSIDGYTYDDRLTPSLVLDASDTSTHTFTASYSGGESVTDAVEIRLYGWQATSGFGNTHIYGVSMDASFISNPEHIEFAPIGVLELAGSYTQLDFATLEIELAGTGNDEFDQLQVTGDVALEGALDLSFIDGFVGSVGQTFDIITANSVTGAFDSVIAPEGMGVSISYLSSIVRVELIAAGLAGDFNGDGMVDAADYTVWRDNLGAGDESSLSGNGDGANGVDQADYTLWVNNYGTSSSASNSVSNSATVPEPSALAMVLLIFGSLVLRRENQTC